MASCILLLCLHRLSTAAFFSAASASDSLCGADATGASLELVTLPDRDDSPATILERVSSISELGAAITELGAAITELGAAITEAGAVSLVRRPTC